MRPALLRAYRETEYEVAGITIRIGRRSPELDAVLSLHRVTQAVFITAHNPRSRRMPPGWNWRMQENLRQFLRRWPVLPARGHWRGWSEEHFVALCDIRPIRQLARRFRQQAIVTLRRAQPSMLLMAFEREATARGVPSGGRLR